MTDGKILLSLVLQGSPWGNLYQQKRNEGYCFYRYATFYSYDEVMKVLADNPSVNRCRKKLDGHRATNGDVSAAIDAFNRVPITTTLWQGD